VDFRLQSTGSPAQIDGVIPGGQPGKVVRLDRASETREMALTADGTFAFPNLAPGEYGLELADIGVIASDIVVEAGVLFHQSFSMRSTLSGKF